MATKPLSTSQPSAQIGFFRPVRWKTNPDQYKITQVALSCLKCLVNGIIYALNQWVIPPLNRAFYGSVAVRPPREAPLPRPPKVPTPAAAAPAAPTVVLPPETPTQAVPTPVPLAEPAVPPAPATVVPPPPLEVAEEKSAVPPGPADSDSEGVPSTDGAAPQADTSASVGWSLVSFLPWVKK